MKKKFSEKYYASRTHGELCQLVTDLTGELHTFGKWTHNELIDKHKKLIKKGNNKNGK